MTLNGYFGLKSVLESAYGMDLRVLTLGQNCSETSRKKTVFWVRRCIRHDVSANNREYNITYLILQKNGNILLITVLKIPINMQKRMCHYYSFGSRIQEMLMNERNLELAG